MLIKRQFWNLAKSNSVGYIESVYKLGIFIQNDYITFRETSSILSNGSLIELSIKKLPYNYKEELQSILSRKQPVYVEYTKELVGSPTKGDIFTPLYVTRILPLTKDVINIKSMTV